MKKNLSTKWFLFTENDFSIGNNMSEKSLKNLMAGVGVVDSLGDFNRQINHIAFDSRKVGEGGLFVAIPGEKFNGEIFIKDALGKGAVAIITQSPLSSLASILIDSKNITAFCVNDSREALSKISANFFNQPSEQLSLTGITGTNGKTTLTYILEALSKAAGRTAGIIGTIDCHYGKTIIPAEMTTPESLDLNQHLRQMADDGILDCFLEVSSHALARKRVYGMSFQTGIFTNLSRDHLDFHGDMEEYKNAKAKLFRENRVKVPVINIDDPVGKEFAEEFSQGAISIGMQSTADFFAENITLKAAESRFTMKSPNGSIEVRTNLLGEHNIYNLLAAAAAASAQGISLNIIQNVFQKIPTIPGRLESVNMGQNFSVLVDYAHTEDALSKSIIASKAFTRGKVIVVFGCGGDRDQGKRKKMGEAALQDADFSVITSDNPRTEDPEQIINDIKKGFPSTGSYKAITNRRKAIEYAINRAEKNDLVLIAGKGHEGYQIVGTKKELFDDREVAREFLRKRVY